MPNEGKKITEYRGIEGLVYAEVTKDTADAFETGEVKDLAGVAELSKTTESSSEPHYYDNIPAIVVTSTGSDDVTVTTSALELPIVAELTGQEYDATTGMMIEGERVTKYFAMGYRTKKTDSSEVLVWRLKGTFSIPDSTHATENDGTDGNGQELTYTGISTTHRFTKTGKPAKAVNVDMGLGLVDDKDFFKTVQTPDTVKAKAEQPAN